MISAARTATAIFALLILAGCGGGGASDSSLPSPSNESPPPVVSDEGPVENEQPGSEPSPGSDPAPAPSEPGDSAEEPADKPAPSPDQDVETSNVPPITGVRLLTYGTLSATSATDGSLVDGDTVNLAYLPQRVNLEAVSADPENTGSVEFLLNGPVELSRIENNPIYTLQNALTHFDTAQGELPEGDYVLLVTPYSEADGAGEKGSTVTLTFSVINDSSLPPKQSDAHDDSYHGTAGQPLTIDAASGVMENDLLQSAADARVSVQSQPRQGTVTLDSSGAFTYRPNQGFTGVDSFNYTLLDGGDQDVATVTLVVSQETASEGFTPIVASDDTRTVYVSSSEGVDTNSGLSINAPVATLDKAFSLVRSGYPDHVLLKRGDVWVDEDLDEMKSGRSAAEPAVVAFYGESGPRPRLKVSDYIINIYDEPLHHVNIMGLNIEAYKLNPADPAFDGESSGNFRMIGDIKDILFEDLKLRFIEFIIQGNPNLGIYATDITIRRSMILDKYSSGTSYNQDSRPSGIYTDTGDGLVIEESVWDHNGWSAEVHGAGSNMYNHNMYISDKGNVGNEVIVRNNIVTRASSHGVHGRPGGLYQNNFFARNAISLQMGYRGSPLSSDTFAYAFDNVITEGQHMNRALADSCANPDLCTGAIWGLHLADVEAADVRVERNIVASRHSTALSNYSKGITESSNTHYSDNIVYSWDDELQGTDVDYPDPGRTLADYNAYLGGERSFEAFMEVVRNRPLQYWDERYSADAINDYIRAGYGR